MEVCERGEELTMELLSSEQDIYNLAQELGIENYKCDKNDAQSMLVWCKRIHSWFSIIKKLDKC